MPKKYVKRTRRPLMRNRKPRKKTSGGFATKADVKRMISRQIENKIYYDNATSTQISNQISANPYFQTLNYRVTQGLGQEGRIGNRVTHKSGTLKGSINFRPYSALTNSRCLAQIVTLVVFKVKNYQTGVNPSYASFFDSMFQTGSSSTGLTNTPIDHIRKLNTDIMTVKAVRKFKMGYSQAQLAAGSPADTSQIQPNNDFKYQAYFNINLSKMYKKTQIFNDTTELDSHNDNLFFMVYLAPADGSAFTSTPLEITWDLELTYEDA